MTVVQELNPIDQSLNPRDRELRNNILQHVSEDDILYYCDEVYFHLSGCVKQNFRYCSRDNFERVTVWCSVADTGIVSSYFFEEGPVTINVTSDSRIHITENFKVTTLITL